jgi:anti-sigma regulatory factor (Ser/Thr protein kinase)
VRPQKPGPFELDVAATLAAPATARAAVSAWITDHVSDAMLVDVHLLVGELVANSVLHPDVADGASISVRAEIIADVLRLEVGDCGSTGAIVTRAPDLAAGGGFGLNVVELLSRRWGVNRDAGTQVWAEIPFAAA